MVRSFGCTPSMRTARGIGIVFFAAMALVAPACASDDAPEPPGTGGSVGSGGTPATGGTAGSGGGVGVTGGAGGTGGKATGGASTGGRASGGSDGESTDGGCSPPRRLYYDTPGCGASAPAPECGGPMFDACAFEVCSCDGVTMAGCGDFSKPWRRMGPCNDGGGPDASD